MAFVSL